MMHGWVLSGHPTNLLLFVTLKGIFSKLLYIKPNPYYSLFGALGVLCYQSYINSWRCTEIPIMYIVIGCSLIRLPEAAYNFLLQMYLDETY